MEDLKLDWSDEYEIVSLMADCKQIRSLPACVIYPKLNSED